MLTFPNPIKAPIKHARCSRNQAIYATTDRSTPSTETRAVNPENSVLVYMYSTYVDNDRVEEVWHRISGYFWSMLVTLSLVGEEDIAWVWREGKSVVRHRLRPTLRSSQPYAAWCRLGRIGEIAWRSQWLSLFMVNYLICFVLCTNCRIWTLHP